LCKCIISGFYFKPTESESPGIRPGNLHIPKFSRWLSHSLLGSDVFHIPGEMLINMWVMELIQHCRGYEAYFYTFLDIT
jgi:hypothetical protein